MENNKELKISDLITNQPFSMTFAWSNRNVKVELVNGEDVLKLASVFEHILKSNNIEYKITMTENYK